MKHSRLLCLSISSSLVLTVLFVFMPLSESQVYSIKRLPTLGGTATARHPNWITGINQSGQATGSSPSPSDPQRAFLWTPRTGMLDIGGMQGQAVNDLGHVAGTYSPTGTGHAFFWTPSTGLQDLGPANQISNGLGLNNLDQVTGVFNPNPNNLNFHGFLWTPATSTLEDLGTLGGKESFPIDINDSGQVVGLADTNTGQAPFIWAESTGMQVIGDGFANASAINEAGQVAGLNNSGHAALWSQADGTQDLGVLPGTNSSIAYAMNNRGVVVGRSWAGLRDPGFVFIWSPTQGMSNVNSLCNNKNQNWRAMGINDAGQIAINKKGGVALILTPINSVAASASQNPSHFGQSVTLAATTNSIAGSPPDGENITFMDSTTVLGTAPLVNGTATITLSSLAVGVHPITATYPGDTNYAAQTSKALRQKVVTP
jgi:probable HAF family extracellular repeat protein